MVARHETRLDSLVFSVDDDDGRLVDDELQQGAVEVIPVDGKDDHSVVGAFGEGFQKSRLGRLVVEMGGEKTVDVFPLTPVTSIFGISLAQSSKSSLIAS